MDNRPICYKIGHGAIIIYGEKIEYYTNYLDNNSSSAESLCIYCKNHGLHMFYFPERNLFGFIDYCHFQKLKKKYFRIDFKVLAPCIGLGVSPFIMQATESVINVCFNSSLLKYGGDLAVGAMTVLATVMQFSMLPLQGLTQGAQPITSYSGF